MNVRLQARLCLIGKSRCCFISTSGKLQGVWLWSSRVSTLWLWVLGALSFFKQLIFAFSVFDFEPKVFDHLQALLALSSEVKVFHLRQTLLGLSSDKMIIITLSVRRVA